MGTPDSVLYSGGAIQVSKGENIPVGTRKYQKKMKKKQETKNKENQPIQLQTPVRVVHKTKAHPAVSKLCLCLIERDDYHNSSDAFTLRRTTTKKSRMRENSDPCCENDPGWIVPPWCVWPQPISTRAYNHSTLNYSLAVTGVKDAITQAYNHSI